MQTVRPSRDREQRMRCRCRGYQAHLRYDDAMDARRREFLADYVDPDEDRFDVPRYGDAMTAVSSGVLRGPAARCTYFTSVPCDESCTAGTCATIACGGVGQPCCGGATACIAGQRLLVGNLRDVPAAE